MTNTRGIRIAIITLLSAAPLAAGADGIPRPTEPMRQEHRNLQLDLRHLDQRLGLLARPAAPEAAKVMAETLRFFEHHIRPHAAWEERVLYPMVDQKAGSPAAHPFTASLRHEHQIVGRWVDELASISRRPRPDPLAFMRLADKLLGLVTAHFEEEEQVLLPILDATMSPDDFRALMRADAGDRGRRVPGAAGERAGR